MAKVTKVTKVMKAERQKKVTQVLNEEKKEEKTEKKKQTKKKKAEKQKKVTKVLKEAERQEAEKQEAEKQKNVTKVLEEAVTFDKVTRRLTTALTLNPAYVAPRMVGKQLRVGGVTRIPSPFHLRCVTTRLRRPIELYVKIESASQMWNTADLDADPMLGCGLDACAASSSSRARRGSAAAAVEYKAECENKEAE